MTWLPAGLTFIALEACSSLCVSFSLQNYNIFSINLTKIKKNSHCADNSRLLSEFY